MAGKQNWIYLHSLIWPCCMNFKRFFFHFASIYLNFPWSTIVRAIKYCACLVSKEIISESFTIQVHNLPVLLFLFLTLFTTGGAVGIALACLAIGAIVGAIVMFVIQKKFPNGFRNRDGYLNPVFDDSSRYWHTDRQTYVVLLIFYTHVYLYCIVLSTNKSCLFLYKLQYESLSSVRQSKEE